MPIANCNDPSRTVGYDYDNFGRLTSAETAGSWWGLAWNYDPYNNQLSQSLTKGTGPTRSVSVDANTNRINGFSYDAAGNVLSDGTKSYAYNAENQVTELTGGIDGRDGDYRYDAMGGRVARISAGVTTLYFFDAGEFQVGSGWQKLSVFLGREKLVEYSANRTWFFHSDHLGTPRVRTNLSGGVEETWDSYPFGEAWGATATPDQHRYTGHLRDYESENDYAGARYYASLHARWLSVDAVRGSAANPQSLNRYSYVMNDPVNFIDPDGRSAVPRGSQQCEWISVTLREFVHGDPVAWSDTVLFCQAMPFYAWTRARQIGEQGRGAVAGFFKGALQKEILEFRDRVDEIRIEPSLVGDDCEKMAQIFEAAGSHFSSGFMATLALFSILTEMGILDAHETRSGREHFGDNGFKDNFKDGSNQVRHFAAMFMGGFVSVHGGLGSYLGAFIAAQYRDWRDNDAQDLALNPHAMDIGAHAAIFGFSGVAAMIRERICE